MTPILFPADAASFETQGLGALTEAISCEITEAINGEYELAMTYPASGRRYADIKNRCIIYAKPDPYRGGQPFRIYRITKPMSGVVTVYARHISYDLSGVPVLPFQAASAPAAMQGLGEHAAIQSPFTFSSTVEGSGSFAVAVPVLINQISVPKLALPDCCIAVERISSSHHRLYPFHVGFRPDDTVHRSCSRIRQPSLVPFARTTVYAPYIMFSERMTLTQFHTAHFFRDIRIVGIIRSVPPFFHQISLELRYTVAVVRDIGIHEIVEILSDSVLPSESDFNARIPHAAEIRRYASYLSHGHVNLG